MIVKIEKGTARGKVTAPPSKSMAHRLVISAAMCRGESRIRGISDCEDVRATVTCLTALGVSVVREGDDLVVVGTDMTSTAPNGVLDAGESGSTLRFLIPVAMLSGKTVMFRGKEGLMRRPMDVYERLASERGLVFLGDGESITVRGRLPSGEYHVVGNVSSQFISGLLFALPTLEGDSRIRITPPIESRSYIEMTLAAIRLFGIRAEWEGEHTIFIPGGQHYTAADVTVEGDYSGAAFTDAFNILSGEVSVLGLNPDSIQGDKVYKKYYEMLDSGIPTVHIGDCPDLGPILFALAAAKRGGVFTGTKRLKIKESDRAEAMAEELKKFGVTVSVYEDKTVVYPVRFEPPTERLHGHNDHRIVMSLAILLTLVGGEIEGAEAISKSYPQFFSDLRKLGIGVTEYEI
ncbi:MAG: 3-phosphoshikimate 1-carboxyvinyltransferase [Clostridia bacterium]|nr:3-phosphoshikimate 1-carboxyvinyltransferase [Clostridia bacterium]